MNYDPFDYDGTFAGPNWVLIVGMAVVVGLMLLL